MEEPAITQPDALFEHFAIIAAQLEPIPTPLITYHSPSLPGIDIDPTVPYFAFPDIDLLKSSADSAENLRFVCRVM